MKYNILKTGSKGNAVIVDDIILLDCGIPFKGLKDYYYKLQVVLISHIHGDHFNKATVKRLAKERPTLRFGVGVWLVSDLVACGVKKTNIDIIMSSVTSNYGLFKVKGIDLVHDVDNFGFKIFKDDQKLAYITDTSHLDDVVVKDYDIYLVEANYKHDEIMKKIADKEANGEFVYEKRVLETHLSEEQATEWIYNNATKECIVEYLHKHKEEKNVSKQEVTENI